MILFIINHYQKEVYYVGSYLYNCRIHSDYFSFNRMIKYTIPRKGHSTVYSVYDIFTKQLENKLRVWL